MEVITNKTYLKQNSYFKLGYYDIGSDTKNIKDINSRSVLKVETHPQYLVNYATKYPDYNTYHIGSKITNPWMIKQRH